MKRLFSIILGVVIFMVPLLVFAESPPQIKASNPYIHFTSYNKEYYITSSGKVWYDAENGAIRPCTGQPNFNVYSVTLSGAFPMPDGTAFSADLNRNYQGSLQIPTLSNLSGTMNLYTSALGTTTVYNAGPPVVNYTVPVGSTARFSLNSGYTSESLTVHANGDTATVTIKTVNTSNASTTSQYTVSTTLVSGCTKYNEVTVNSSGTSNPDKQWVVISSTMPMQIIGSGGVIDDPSTEQGYLGSGPDTVTFMNRTGHTQYIRINRTTAGDSQYTIATWSQLAGGNYALVGSLPYVKDTNARNLPVKTGQNIQIYNHGGTTRYEYPVIEGLTFVLSTRGGTYGDTESPNLGIGEVDLGDSPDLQTPIPDPAEYETSIGGFMKWIGDTVTGMFGNILESLQSVITTVSGFAGQVGSLGQITGDFFGFPSWMVGLITLGITLPIIAGIICRRLL